MAALFAAAFALAAAAWWFERRQRLAAESRHGDELARQRARVAAQIDEQADRTAALFDRMIEGIAVTDAAGKIRLANRAAGELFGFEAPAVGRTLLEAMRRHEVGAVAEKLEREPEVLGYEMCLEGAGAVRYLQINALALRDTQGERAGAIFVFHDVTRLRRLEAMRQEFVANVSHELRTPLSLIKSAAETLIDSAREDPATRARFLEIIDRNANRLTLLIDDLLLLSTLDSGRLRLELQPVRLRSAAQEVAEDFQTRAAARRMGLGNAVPGELQVRADPERLRQVLSNLVDNAIKYGREEGRVELTAAALPDGRIEVGVRDDGPGLPPEVQPRIFERFYRVDKARSREQGGTGLGLAIVKHVVQAHGGEVRLESRPGQGTTFFFILPPASGDQPAPTSRASA
ncbi:MAG TPA: ATP-binding protein [Opitutaceae bacterium]|nr:ATP-binding protein [Opitutaceae bacterium]